MYVAHTADDEAVRSWLPGSLPMVTTLYFTVTYCSQGTSVITVLHCVTRTG